MRSLAVALVATLLFPSGISQHDIVSGLFSSDTADWCCWMGAHATLSLPVPAGANALVIKFLIPSYAAVPGGTAIAASIDGIAARSVCCFPEGVYQAAFAIPQRPVARRVIVVLTPSSSFVPARRRIDRDTRTLSILLRDVLVEDTLTGRQYRDGVPIASGMSRTVTFLWWALLVVIGAVTAVLARRRTAYAWMMLLATAPFNLTGPTLVGAFAGLAMQRIPLRPLVDRRALAIAGAFGLFILSAAMSSIGARDEGAAVWQTLLTGAYLGAFALAALAYRSDPDRALLRTTLAWVTIVVSGAALLQLWYGAPETMLFAGRVVPRVAGVLEGPNQLGAFLGIALPLLLSLSIGGRLRADTVVAAVLGTSALLLTFSRGGVFACVLACVLVLLLRRQWRRRVIVFAATAALFVAVAALAFHNAPVEARGKDAYNGGLGTRAVLWSSALAMWRSNPLLGVGPANYEPRVSEYVAGVRNHPNNYYLQVLAEQGVVGLALWLLLLGATIYALAGKGDALAVGVLAVVIALGCHQLVDGLLIYPKIGNAYWILVGMAV